MGLVRCHECGTQIRDEPKTCPHCGAKIKRRKRSAIVTYGGGFLLLVFGAILAMAFAFYHGNRG
jgi:predicted nucleic acid-binding Zn ribbon protein